jgi:hypothetical protein
MLHFNQSVLPRLVRIQRVDVIEVRFSAGNTKDKVLLLEFYKTVNSFQLHT